MPKPSSAPSKKELLKLHKTHGGNVVAISRALDRPYATVQNWFRRHGINGTGKGGAPSQSPPETELRAAYEQCGGSYAAIGAKIGASPSAVANWCKKLGLKGLGRETLSRAYPMELTDEIDDGCIVVFSDAHWQPGAPKSLANEALIETCRKLKPKFVIANGDQLDGAKISRHDPLGWEDLPDLEDEVHECQVRLAEIAKAAGPDCRKIMTLGNHSVRFERYIAQNAPQLRGIGGTRLADHFPGWEVAWAISFNQRELVVKHRLAGGVHAAYNNALKAGTSVICGHLHSQQVTQYTDWKGTRWGVDAGTLSDVDSPAFRYTEQKTPLNWRSGFCVVTFRGGRMLPPQLVSVLADGSVYLPVLQPLIKARA